MIRMALESLEGFLRSWLRRGFGGLGIPAHSEDPIPLGKQESAPQCSGFGVDKRRMHFTCRTSGRKPMRWPYSTTEGEWRGPGPGPLADLYPRWKEESRETERERERETDRQTTAAVVLNCKG